MPVVRFVKQDISVECPVGTNLRALALANEIDLYAFPNNVLNCRGHGLCTTCRVKVDEPRAVSAPTPTEENKVAWEGPLYRLACQCAVRADLEVITNPRRQQGWTNHPTYKWMEKQLD
jgi:ferredoxin